MRMLSNASTSGRLVDASRPQAIRAIPPLRTSGRRSTGNRCKGIAQGLAREILARPEVEGDVISFLNVSEKYLTALRAQKHEPQKKGPQVVKYGEGRLPGPVDYDVVICGGTLGLFLATSLQLRGHKVCIVEKRLVEGRNQEWNISRGELQVLLDLGLLTPAELESAIASEFNPIRVGFLGGEDIWTSNCLNLGVHPRTLLDILKRKYLAAGGVMFENTAFKGATLLEDGMVIKLGPGGREAAVSVGDTNRPNGLEAAPSAPTTRPKAINARLLLDCMGHYSDIVKQVRGKVKPDGMCMVVGSCAEGFTEGDNTSADLLYSISHARSDMQFFWEAFPAEGGNARTTYMFAYSDAHPGRPSFENLLDTYFELLPQYQGEPLENLQFKRILFGGFPCYNNGPLPVAFDRVMQIGDASAGQSPLSFGGFGSMMRHLGRLTRALGQALTEDRLSRTDLSWVQPYQPSLAASWLFQRSMSVGVGQTRYPDDLPNGVPKAAVAVPQHSALGSRDEWDNPRDPNKLPRLSPLAKPYTAPVLALGQQLNPSPYSSLITIMATADPLANMLAPYTPIAGRQFGAGMADPQEFLDSMDSYDDPEIVTQTITSLPSVGIAPEAAAAAKAAAAAVQAAQKQRTAASVSASPSGGFKIAPSKAKVPVTTFEADYSDLPVWLKLPHTHINEILGTNFRAMKILGDRVLRPFLQDTIQFVPLTLSMTGMLLLNPIVISRVFTQVGPKTLGMWFIHYTALGTYTLGHVLLAPLRSVIPGFKFQRFLDALEYGSGMDHVYHGPEEEQKQPATPAALSASSAPMVVLASAGSNSSATEAREPVSTRR